MRIKKTTSKKHKKIRNTIFTKQKKPYKNVRLKVAQKTQYTL